MNRINTAFARAAMARACLRAPVLAITFALLLALVSKPALAAEEGEEHESPALGSIDYIVYSPIIESGERSIEVRGWRQIDSNDEIDGSGALKVALETTMTDFWLIEPYLEFEKEANGSLKLDSVEIENRFQLTPQGKYWLDVGFLLEAELNVNGERKRKLRYGPLLQKQFGRTVVTTNLVFQNAFGGDVKGHDKDTLFSYAANIRYLLSPLIEPGISAYGGVGALADLEETSEQVHQLGPSIQGKFELAPGMGLKYRTEAVFGLTHGSPDATWVAQLEYEF